MKKIYRFLVAAALAIMMVFSLAGCMRKSADKYYAAEEYSNGDFETSVDTLSSGMINNEVNAPVDQSQSKMNLDWSADEKFYTNNREKGKESQDVSGKQQDQETEKPKRVYSGYADLIVEEVEESRTRIEAMAVDLGGYVESMYENSIIIRVPAAHFDKAFKTILDFGKVRNQSIQTADVTELYSDLIGRLEIAQTSRNRLYELLSRTTDTNEQVLILKEIGRLTEEIESIKLFLQSLDSFISYSRITVSLTPRLAVESTGKEIIPFTWIRKLSPLSPVSRTLKATVELKPGDDFAVFEKESIYLAENFNGARIGVSTVKNKPLGDGDFWQKALQYHLKDYYREAETMVVPFGKAQVYGVLFTSKDRDPFQYFVGVAVHKRKLHVIEIFSPTVDRDLYNRLFKAMEEGRLNI